MSSSTQLETDKKVIEVYVHTEGSTELQLAPMSRDDHVRDLLATDDPAASGESIWLAEQDEPLDVEISLVDAGVTDRCHVHRGCCTSVKARVRYHDQHLDEEFPPTTRLAAVSRYGVPISIGARLAQWAQCSDSLPIDSGCIAASYRELPQGPDEDTAARANALTMTEAEPWSFEASD